MAGLVLVVAVSGVVFGTSALLLPVLVAAFVGVGVVVVNRAPLQGRHAFEVAQHGAERAVPSAVFDLDNCASVSGQDSFHGSQSDE